MRIQAKDTAQVAYLDDPDAGEGLSIFFSQGQADTVRWRLDVSAKLDTGVELQVGTFWVSPPGAAEPKDRLSRLVAIAVCPGAISWSVLCQAQPGSQASIAAEDAAIDLFSSKCCTAPKGLNRVSERYGYLVGSGAGPINVTFAWGRIATRIIATGLTGGGSFTVANGGAVTVAAGQSIVLEPKAPIAQDLFNPIFVFTNVSYVVEYLESA